MLVDILEVYQAMVEKHLSVVLLTSLSSSVEGPFLRVFDQNTEIYIQPGAIRVLRADLSKLEVLGEYAYTDDFDFLRVYALILSLIYDVPVQDVIDVLVFKKSDNWRDFAQVIASILSLETEITEDGLYIENIGFFIEKDTELELTTVKSFTFKFPFSKGKTLREGVLSLLSISVPSDEFIQQLVHISLGEPFEEESFSLDESSSGEVGSEDS